MKNPFKKGSVIDTVINVGIGGAANVAMDYIFGAVSALDSVKEYKDIIKIAVGAVGGSMISGNAAKYARPAFDGIATVGASNLIASYLPTEQAAPAGMPFIGRPGKGFNMTRHKGMKGTGAVPFQGK